MPQDLFPDPGPDPDDAEPDGFPPAEDAPGPDQGLYITLPAEQLTLAGFSQGGASDTMAPGPLLATVVHTVTGEDGSGLAGCSDDQLMGIISAARRQQSRDEWTVMAAIGEFARRAGTGVEGEFAADELAAELHMSQQSAAGQMDFATEVAKRLPQTFAALAAGQIHPIHLRIIEDETRFLSDADAAKADAFLAGAAPGMTFGELRYAARKLVLKLDPDTARKRKEAARREAHVRRFQEESGNAGMVARELPCDEVLASWQHVEQRALDLRAAGVPGTLQDLRVRAYLDLLQERDSRAAPAGVVPAASGEGGQDQPAPDQPPTGHRPARPARQPPRRGPRRFRWPRTVPAPLPARPRRRAGAGLEPGRPGHHHHPPDHLPGPLRHPRRSRRVRHARRRRRPRPGRRRSPPLQNPVVHHRPEPRRHCRRPRLPARPPPPARDRTTWHRTTWNRPRRPPPPAPARRRTTRPPSTPGHRTTRHRASGHPVHPADPHHPRVLRPRPRRDRLPAEPQTPAPGPGPQRPVHRTRLRPPRRPLRPGPYPPLGPGRHHLRM